MSDYDRIQSNVPEEFGESTDWCALGIWGRNGRVHLGGGRVYLTGGRGHVHLVHGPDVVEEVGGPEPGVGVRYEVGRPQDVPVARVRADREPGEAGEQRLHRRNYLVADVQHVRRAQLVAFDESLTADGLLRHVHAEIVQGREEETAHREQAEPLAQTDVILRLHVGHAVEGGAYGHAHH